MSVRNWGLVGFGLALLIGCFLPVQAQESNASPGAKADRSTKASETVSVDVRNAPLREVLISLFEQAKVDYTIDPAVGGFVTLHLTEQPMETALRLMLRSSVIPLTYSVDSGVYRVRPRPIEPPAPIAPPASERVGGVTDLPQRRFEVIHLTYIDPADLAQLLGIQLIPFYARGSGAGLAGSGRGSGSGGVAGNGNGLLVGGGSRSGGRSGQNP